LGLELRRASSRGKAEERPKQDDMTVDKAAEEAKPALILAEDEERSHAEIATVIGRITKALETPIYRARQRLRVKSGQPCGKPPDPAQGRSSSSEQKLRFVAQRRGNA